MWLYWALFLWPALAAVVEIRLTAPTSKLAMWILAIFLTLIIGLRFEVGVDWFPYLIHLESAEGVGWLESMEAKDPAYGLLNWIAVSTGSGVWLVNLVCSIIFVSGFFVFCRKLPNPWLALTVGMPYMAIVMAMNYTRQGVAFGLVLWALAFLQEGRILRYVIFIVMAATFHKSAVLLLPFAALSNTRNRFQTFVWISIASALAFLAFVAESLEALTGAYIGTKMESEGGGIRVAMNAVAAFLFLAMRRHFALQSSQRKFWTWLSVATLLCIPAIILSPSSTAVDRVALYFMPIQLLVFAHLPSVVRPWGVRRVTTWLVVFGYGLVMFIWFNYSPYAFNWLPYRFYPLEVK